jgi:chromate transport protein ChrA
MGGSVQPAEEQKAPLRAFLLYFLRLGTVGFGGPIALASRMESELVKSEVGFSGKTISRVSPLRNSPPGHSLRNSLCTLAMCAQA